MKILFVCSRNKWRSRTAETIFKNNGLHQIKSAGTEKSARIRITQNMINWAEKLCDLRAFVANLLLSCTLKKQ